MHKLHSGLVTVMPISGNINWNVSASLGFLSIKSPRTSFITKVHALASQMSFHTYHIRTSCSLAIFLALNAPLGSVMFIEDQAMCLLDGDVAHRRD